MEAQQRSDCPLRFQPTTRHGPTLQWPDARRLVASRTQRATKLEGRSFGRRAPGLKSPSRENDHYYAAKLPPENPDHSLKKLSGLCSSPTLQFNDVAPGRPGFKRRHGWSWPRGQSQIYSVQFRVVTSLNSDLSLIFFSLLQVKKHAVFGSAAISGVFGRPVT